MTDAPGAEAEFPRLVRLYGSRGGWEARALLPSQLATTRESPPILGEDAGPATAAVRHSPDS